MVQNGWQGKSNFVLLFQYSVLTLILLKTLQDFQSPRRTGAS